MTHFTPAARTADRARSDRVPCAHARARLRRALIGARCARPPARAKEAALAAAGTAQAHDFLAAFDDATSPACTDADAEGATTVLTEAETASDMAPAAPPRAGSGSPPLPAERVPPSGLAHAAAMRREGGEPHCQGERHRRQSTSCPSWPGASRGEGGPRKRAFPSTFSAFLFSSRAVQMARHWSVRIAPGQERRQAAKHKRPLFALSAARLRARRAQRRGRWSRSRRWCMRRCATCAPT